MRSRTRKFDIHDLPGPHRPGLLVTSFLAALIFLTCNPGLSEAAPEPSGTSDAEKPHCVVFVIDVSTSMYDIMDDLKKALKDYVREAEPGQSIAIVTFGKSANLVYRKTIRSASDMKRMLRFCDELCCSDERTYIPCGLHKGLSELYRFYRANPSGQHTLVFMSDGVNNPPDDIDEDSAITYEAVKERFLSKFKPGKDWFITYVALKGVSDLGLADFVEECLGVTIRLGKKLPSTISEVEVQTGLPVDSDNTLDLGTSCLPIEVRIPLFLYPRRGKLEGQSIEVKSILADLAAERQLRDEVRPGKIICEQAPKKAEVTLSIRGDWDKEIRGALLLRPVAGDLLIVHPSQFRFRFEEPSKVIIGIFSRALDDYTWGPSGRLDIGPLEPGGGPKEEKLALRLEGPYPPQQFELRVVPSIDLPSEVLCNSEVNLNGILTETASITVRAWAEEAAPAGREWMGQLSITSTESLPLVSRSSIPLRIFTSAKAPADHRNYWIWIIIAMLLGLLGSLVYRKMQLRKFVPVDGWLVLLERPKSLKIKNINLNTLSQELEKSKLIIGSDPTSDIILPHDSVEKRHCQIRSGRHGSPIHMHIRPLELSDVKVNDFLIDEETNLQDRDIIDIGAFQFIYSNSHLKQVVVHYKDGDVRYGVPLTWNIEEDGFVLRPEGKGSADLQMYIPFRDLKAVFFVKDFDKEIARRMKFSSIYAKKDHVVIEFKDGEKLDGYTAQSYDPKAPRFFVVPKVEKGKEENNIFILVERRFTKKIKVLAKDVGRPQR